MLEGVSNEHPGLPPSSEHLDLWNCGVFSVPYIFPNPVWKYRRLRANTEDRRSTNGLWRHLRFFHWQQSGRRLAGVRASVCTLWETSSPSSQVFSSERRCPLAPYPAYWQEIAWTARFWLLNCECKYAGYPANEPSSPPMDG